MFANSAPENICVLRLSAIGDTCHALAVIRNLQDNWPDARITWIIGKTEATLMGDIRDVEFITFDKAQGLAAYRHVRRQLAGTRFDVALCMHASMRANLLCREIPAAVRVGFDKATRPSASQSASAPTGAPAGLSNCYRVCVRRPLKRSRRRR